MFVQSSCLSGSSIDVPSGIAMSSVDFVTNEILTQSHQWGLRNVYACRQQRLLHYAYGPQGIEF